MTVQKKQTRIEREWLDFNRKPPKPSNQKNTLGRKLISGKKCPKCGAKVFELGKSDMGTVALCEKYCWAGLLNPNRNFESTKCKLGQSERWNKRHNLRFSNLEKNRLKKERSWLELQHQSRLENIRLEKERKLSELSRKFEDLIDKDASLVGAYAQSDDSTKELVRYRLMKSVDLDLRYLAGINCSDIHEVINTEFITLMRRNETTLHNIIKNVFLENQDSLEKEVLLSKIINLVPKDLAYLNNSIASELDNLLKKKLVEDKSKVSSNAIAYIREHSVSDNRFLGKQFRNSLLAEFKVNCCLQLAGIEDDVLVDEVFLDECSNLLDCPYCGSCGQIEAVVKANWQEESTNKTCKACGSSWDVN